MAVKKITAAKSQQKKKAPTKSQNKVKNPNGRPVKYTEEFIDNEAVALLEWIENDNDDKTYLGCFARERGYDRHRLVEFCNSNKTFSAAYRDAKTWQERKFVRKALTREWDPGFTKYVMARVCDPIWKSSWDQAESNTTIQTPNVTINKIVADDKEDCIPLVNGV